MAHVGESLLSRGRALGTPERAVGCYVIKGFFEGVGLFQGGRARRVVIGIAIVWVCEKRKAIRLLLSWREICHLARCSEAVSPCALRLKIFGRGGYERVCELVKCLESGHVSDSVGDVCCPRPRGSVPLVGREDGRSVSAKRGTVLVR